MEDHRGHRQRMKEEFLRGGMDHMQPHRVLELLLFFAIPQGDTNGLAHRLLNYFDGSLARVLDASYEELLEVKGVGSHTAVLLRLISSLTRYYYTEKACTDPIRDPIDRLAHKMMARYVGCGEEHLIMVCLDNALRELFFDVIKVGVADAVQLQFRDMARIALRCNATNVVLGHNHPGGLALPSRADRETTIALARSFRELGIDLLDHIIVSGDEYVSMAQSGVFSEVFRDEAPDIGPEK